MTRYKIQPVEAAEYESEMDYTEFMLVFRTGLYQGQRLMSICPVGQPTKLVQFAENLPVSFQNVVQPKVS